MNHEQYVANRVHRDPRFAFDRAAAAAELEFASVVAEQRHARKMNLETLADETGISIERLGAIEGGETATLSEVLWLAHILDLAISIDSDLRLTATIRPTVTVTYLRGQEPKTIGLTQHQSEGWLTSGATTSGPMSSRSAVAR
jgi:transcriptional regulator with XRE-family HTH domain